MKIELYDTANGAAAPIDEDDARHLLCETYGHSKALKDISDGQCVASVKGGILQRRSEETIESLRAELAAVTKERDNLQAAIDGMEPVMWTNYHMQGAITNGALGDFYWNVPLYRKPEVK